MNQEFLKKYFIYIILSLVMIFIVVTFLVFGNRVSNVSPDVSPGPEWDRTITNEDVAPGVITDRPLPGTNYADILTEEDREEINKDALVGKLLKRLPYEGKDFILSYSYRKNTFTANLRASKEVVARQELVGFLKENQIEDTSWLNNYTEETFSDEDVFH